MYYSEVCKHIDTNLRSDMTMVLFKQVTKLDNWECFEKTGRWDNGYYIL